MMEAAGLAETFLSVNLHGVFSHNRVTFTLTAVRISELTLKLLSTLSFAEFFCAGLDESGFETRQKREIFFHFILKRPDRLFGAHKVSR
jgi:hypothetical protein